MSHKHRSTATHRVYSRLVLGEQKNKGVEVHQFMPQFQVPHHDVVRLIPTYVEILLGKEVSAVTYQDTIKQT